MVQLLDPCKRGVFVAAVLGVLITPLEAHAQNGEICAALERVLDGKRALRQEDLGEWPATCGRALAQNGEEIFCYVTFPYRSEQAAQVFEDLTTQISNCETVKAPPDEEANVNHPDAYVQRTFNASDGSVSLALKDKAALESTLIFLRIKARAR